MTALRRADPNAGSRTRAGNGKLSESSHRWGPARLLRPRAGPSAAASTARTRAGVGVGLCEPHTHVRLQTDQRSGRLGRVEGVVAARSTVPCRPLSPWFVQPSPIDWPATLSWSAPAFWLWSIDVLFAWVFDESLLPTSVNCGFKFTLSLWTVA